MRLVAAANKETGLKATLCRVEEIPREGTLKVDLFGRTVLVFRNGGAPKAYLDCCPHYGGPLELREDRLVCLWHGSEFGRDGRCIGGPAREDSRLIRLDVRVEEGLLKCAFEIPE